MLTKEKKLYKWIVILDKDVLISQKQIVVLTKYVRLTERIMLITKHNYGYLTETDCDADQRLVTGQNQIVMLTRDWLLDRNRL